MNLRRSWLLVFFGFGVVLVAAVCMVTASVLRLERDRVVANAESSRQDAIRLSLWRLEALLAPLVVLEARRPVEDYQSFASRGLAYTRLYSQIRPGDVLTPSPLLKWTSSIFPLHFQFDVDGELSSPQAPDGNMLDLANTIVPEETILDNRGRLERFGDEVTCELIASRVDQGESRWAATVHGLGRPVGPASPLAFNDPAGANASPKQQVAQQAVLTRNEWSARNRVAGNYRQQSSSIDSLADEQTAVDSPDGVGPLVPFWTGAAAEEPGELLLARRVRMEAGDGSDAREVLQGIVCDWGELKRVLLAEIVELLPDADLVPVVGSPSQGASSNRMVSVPVEVVTPPLPPIDVDGMTPERMTLGALWMATLAGLVAAGLGLRATIVYGEKKSRFASAVTHELRTPLTTFQMYTEMLAEDMVKDDSQRREFLETLKRESVRLSGLVESVLAYARVEQRRHPTRVEPVDLDELVERCVPDLRHRASSAGLDLRVERGFEGKPRLRVDPDGVALILGNLVDNAGKYAAEAEDPAVELRVTTHQRHVLFDLRDHGPGIPAEEVDEVFGAFERGQRREDGLPGFGLGLSLSRGLAREMGGDLQLLPHDDDGAWFRLTLPLTVAT